MAYLLIAALAAYTIYQDYVIHQLTNVVNNHAEHLSNQQQLAGKIADRVEHLITITEVDANE